MGTPRQSPFTGSSRRKQTTVVIFSALILFTFCFIWLLSLSQPSSLLGHDHDEIQHDIQRVTIKTPTGSYTGKVNEKYRGVNEFLNVPYGLSTSGQNRFMPPVPVPESNQEFDATKLALACPQFISPSRTIWSEQLPWYRIPRGQVGRHGRTAELSSEECLSLAIWTPSNVTEASELPVVMFWPGERSCTTHQLTHAI